MRMKLENCDRSRSKRLNLKSLLHENPEQLLLLVDKKLLLFRITTGPETQGITGGFVFEPQRSQVVVEARDDLVTHGNQLADTVLQAFPKT